MVLSRILAILTLSLFSLPVLAESERSHLKFQTEVHLGLNGLGAGLGLFLPGDSRLDLSCSQRLVPIYGHTAEENSCRFEFQSFLGNSFYYSVGLMQRATQLRVDGRTSKTRSLGPHVLIGNEWQWDHFFIGAEWLGFMKPLSSSYENEYPANTEDYYRNLWEEEARTVAEQTSGIALNLFLGFSF